MSRPMSNGSRIHRFGVFIFSLAILYAGAVLLWIALAPEVGDLGSEEQPKRIKSHSIQRSTGLAIRPPADDQRSHPEKGPSLHAGPVLFDPPDSLDILNGFDVPLVYSSGGGMGFYHPGIDTPAMFERAGQAVLYHPSEHVREMALLALNGTIEAINYPYPDEEQPGLVDHDNRARDVLLHVLQHDPSAYIRHSALSCLLYIRDPQTWDRVVQTARNDSSLDVQEYLYLKLVDYANDPFYETNMEYVRDPEDLRRVLEHRRQESLRVLKETLEMHPDSGMRQTIKECLEESQ